MIQCLQCGHASETEFKFCPSCGTENSAAAGDNETLVGKVLNNKYRILEEVGAGAMGKVFRAEHTTLKRSVAIKVLHRDLMLNDETVRRFQGEGIAAGKFNHPYAIQIFDFDKDDASNWFLAMEFVEGNSLKDYLHEKGAVSQESAIRIAVMVLEALAEAHTQGIIHRDLKPDNIMVVGEKSGELAVKVLDFGLSKLIDNKLGASMLTQTGRILGTPRYMAPEQWQGSDVDHRIDIYAMGLVLYEMLTGETPFSSTTVHEAMMRSATSPVPSLLDAGRDLEVPEGLDDIIQKSLAKDPEERFATAEEMIAALLELDGSILAKPRPGSRLSTHSASARSRRESTRRSKRGPLPMLAGVAAIAAIGLVAFQFFGSPGNAKTYSRVSDKPEAERSKEEKLYLAELLQARNSLRENDHRGAMTAIERAIRLPCRDAESYLVRGRIYRARRDDDTALLDFEEAVKLDGSFALAIAEIGWVHFDTGDVEEAQSKFQAATDLDDKLASAIVGLASIRLEDGDDDEAKSHLEKVDRASNSAEVQVRLGRALLTLDNVDGAIDAFRRAKRSDSFEWRAHAGLGTALLRLSEPGSSGGDEAEAALREAVQINPDAETARVTLATMFIGAKKWPEAIQVTEDGLARKSDQKELHILKGIALYSTDRVTEAIDALARGTDGDTDDIRALTLLGVLYQGRKEFDLAIDCYQRVLADDAENFQAALNEGLCLTEKRDYENAAKMLRHAIAIDDEKSYPHLALGIVEMEFLGNYPSAITEFERYRELGGTDARVAGWLIRLGK